MRRKLIPMNLTSPMERESDEATSCDVSRHSPKGD